MDKTSFRIFISALIVSLFIFGILLLITLFNTKEEEVKLKSVTNQNIFFTVENVVNKYIQLIEDEEKEKVYNVIDDKYKKENTITLYNVINSSNTIPKYTSFIAQKIMEDTKEKNTYYVSGYLELNNNLDNSSSNRKSYSLIVKLNFDTYTYTIIPKNVGVMISANK